MTPPTNREALKLARDALASAKYAIKGREHTGFIDAALAAADAALAEPVEAQFLICAGGDGYYTEIVPQSRLDDAYLLTQWGSLDDIDPEQRAAALEQFHDPDEWLHMDPLRGGKGRVPVEFSISFEDGWVRVVRLPAATPPTAPVVASDALPPQQAVVDRIMSDTKDYAVLCAGFSQGKCGSLDGEELFDALRTAIEELARQAAEAQEAAITLAHKVGALEARAALAQQAPASAKHPLTPADISAAYDRHAGEPTGEPAETQAALDVLAERRRQIEAEGHTPEHDDEDNGGLARAAAAYAMAAAAFSTTHPGIVRWLDEAVNRVWPWTPMWWKPADPRRMLVKAGALILAEIERLDRAGEKKP
jgi:hypothetical protein